MALTPSKMLPLGTPAPAFTLPDPSGHEHSIEDFAEARALLVVFMCNHCPYVTHIAAELGRLGRELPIRGVAMVGIAANDIERFPQDGPESMAAEADARGWVFPYLFDESQEVARAYDAACTPDFYLFDGDRKLVYRGQLDSSRPGNDLPVDGGDLRAAIDAVLAGRAVSGEQTPSIGCNIKWKPTQATA